MKKFTTAYNKQIIMHKAHEMYRDGRFGSWSMCLRIAWSNARIIKGTLDRVGKEARTYGQWLHLGFEVIHGQHNVAQCVIESPRYKNKTTEVLSFFTKLQVCPLGVQAPKA